MMCEFIGMCLIAFTVYAAYQIGGAVAKHDLRKKEGWDD